MIVGFHHIQIAAPEECERAARRFYGEVLGLPEIPKPPELARRGGVWFECGERQLHIGVEKDFRPAAKAHPAFSVIDLDALRAKLEAEGIQTHSDENLPGYHRFYAIDPFGNRLEFLEPEASV